MTDWHQSARLHPYLVCDVFTAEPLQGNQLGVFTDGRAFDAAEMQSLARELNLAETVFLLPARGSGDVRVRIFTPRVELPFAGHPVLGAAFVVGEALELSDVMLETGAGPVSISLERQRGRVVFGRMEQPIPERRPYGRADELLRALDVDGSLLPVDLYRNGPSFVYVALEDEDAVAAVTPDMAALEELNVGAVCFAGRDRFWRVRMFYPGAGVPEDSATGSAAGPLAVHLARHGAIAFGDEIEIQQGVEIGRRSTLFATATGEGDRIDAVHVSGSAVIVAHGHYRTAQRARTGRQ